MGDWGRGLSMFDDSSNHNSQNLSSISKLSYRMGINSMKIKKALKERPKCNPKNEENIRLNKTKKSKKLIKQPSCTTRSMTKHQTETNSKSINKKKSKKGFKKSSKIQSSWTFQFPGKENRAPKTNTPSEITEAKRSSVPRKESRTKILFQKNPLTNGKLQNSKIDHFLPSKSKNFKSGVSDSDSSILGFSQSTALLGQNSVGRTRTHKKSVDKHYSTGQWGGNSFKLTKLLIFRQHSCSNRIKSQERAGKHLLHSCKLKVFVWYRPASFQ